LFTDKGPQSSKFEDTTEAKGSRSTPTNSGDSLLEPGQKAETKIGGGATTPTQHSTLISLSMSEPSLVEYNSPVVDKKGPRLPALIKPEVLEGQHLLSHQEEELSAPDLYIKNPRVYTEAINNLQEQIFELGRPALCSLYGEGDTNVLPLPSSKLLDLHWVMREPNTLNNEVIRGLLLNCITIASAVIGGHKILAEYDFCKKTYNVLVRQSKRGNVVNAVSVKMSALGSLLNLLEEAEAYYGTGIDCSILDETMEDLGEIVKLVLLDLGLYNEPVVGPSGVERTRWVLDLTVSALSVLFLALVSFINSHLCIQETPLGELTRLRIDTPSCPIFMIPRRFLCLNGFIKQPVWIFSAVPAYSHLEENERYYLSIFLTDFADLWGPIGLEYIDGSKDSVSKITVRGGIIQSHTTGDDSLSPLDDETLCHWHGWMEGKLNLQRAQRTSISTTKRLLIGAPSATEYLELNTRPFQISGNCACREKTRFADFYDAFELTTKLPSWTVSERLGQVSGGAYVNILYGHTWKFNAGWTLKDVIVTDWVDHVRDPSHTPKPYYLDYLVVLEISQCSGHSQRISLWDLLKQQILRRYLKKFLDLDVRRDFDTLVQFFPSDTRFTEIWNSVSKEGRDVLKIITKEIISTLRSTGVGEDGKLQAWDLNSVERLDGRRITPRWVSMVKDDAACATFAIITDKCVTYSETFSPRNTKFKIGTDSTILSTAICITAPEQLESCAPHIYTPPDSSREDEHRPDWVLSKPTFEKWKVRLSEDSSSLAISSRRQLLESVRDNSGPDTEALQRIESRRLARKQGQQLRSQTNGSIKEKSLENTTLTNGVSRPTLPNQEFSQSSNYHPNFSPNGVARKSIPLISDGALDFKNGKGEDIGKLILENPQDIDLRTVAEGTPLTARWESRKSGLLATIKAKEATMDKKIVGWTERRSSTISVLPWAISRIAEIKKPAPFVVEYIRGGSLNASQKVLQTYIR
jgi:hypothetical protein